jgi:hypothetical protein
MLHIRGCTSPGATHHPVLHKHHPVLHQHHPVLRPAPRAPAGPRARHRREHVEPPDEHIDLFIRGRAQQPDRAQVQPPAPHKVQQQPPRKVARQTVQRRDVRQPAAGKRHKAQLGQGRGGHGRKQVCWRRKKKKKKKKKKKVARARNKKKIVTIAKKKKLRGF